MKRQSLCCSRLESTNYKLGMWKELMGLKECRNLLVCVRVKMCVTECTSARSPEIYPRVMHPLLSAGYSLDHTAGWQRGLAKRDEASRFCQTLLLSRNLFVILFSASSLSNDLSLQSLFGWKVSDISCLLSFPHLIRVDQERRLGLL